MDWRARVVLGVAVAFLGACSSTTSTTASGAGQGSQSNGTCSVEGTWSSHFQWSGRTPGDLALDVSSDDSVEIPAGNGVSHATGMTTLSGNEVSWTLSDGSTMSGELDSTCSFIASGFMKSKSGTNGTFTARKDGCDADGTWDVNFQWSGRTPGELYLSVSPTQSVDIPAGPGVSQTSGSTEVRGHVITWTLSDGSTMTGTADSTCTTISDGTMRSSTGNTGSFVAQK